MFGSEDALIRLDMSEFMEKYAVSRLVGAPPGYVGYEEGGQLTEAVRRKSYCLVLLDEIEKAHPDVFNILLQIFDDGHLTDAKGRKVDFRNTHHHHDQQRRRRTHPARDAHRLLPTKTEEAKTTEQRYTKMREKLLSELKKTFRPEFLNRIDGTVVFHALSQEQIRQIVDLMLREVDIQLSFKGITLEITDAARDWLGDKGYDETFGARPLRRLIQNEVEDRLSEALLEGKFGPGDTVVIDCDDGGLNLKGVSQPALT